MWPTSKTILEIGVWLIQNWLSRDEKVSPVSKYHKVTASLPQGPIAALIIMSCLCIWMLIRPTKSLNFSLLMRKYRAKAGASSTANSLISWWYAPLSSLLLIQLLVQITLSWLLKTSSSSKLSIKRRICRNFTFVCWFDSSSTILLAEMLTLLILRTMLR